MQLLYPGLLRITLYSKAYANKLQTYTDLITKVAEARGHTSVLPIEVVARMKPLHKAVKDTGLLIQQSPWAFLASSTIDHNNSTSHFSNQNSTSSISPPPQTPLPMTPQSAALGPAVMATVPSTPHGNGPSTNGNGYSGNNGGSVGMSHANNSYTSTSSNGYSTNTNGASVGMSHANNSYSSGNSFNIFNGNVFERADTLLSISSTSSRSGTMTSLSNLDGNMTPATLLSPMNLMNGARFGTSSKVSF